MSCFPTVGERDKNGLQESHRESETERRRKKKEKEGDREEEEEDDEKGEWMVEIKRRLK